MYIEVLIKCMRVVVVFRPKENISSLDTANAGSMTFLLILFPCQYENKSKLISKDVNLQ